MTHAMCEQLDAYLGGDLPDDRRAAFEAHLRACASCRREADEFERLAALLERAAEHERGPERLVHGLREEFGLARRRARLRVFFAISAAALTVAVLGWVWSGGWRAAVDGGGREGVPVAGPREPEQRGGSEPDAARHEPQADAPGSVVRDQADATAPVASTVQVEFPGDVIAVPIESGDPSVTIYWLYPASYVAAGGD